MNINEFVSDLASVDLPNVFNPYRSVCEIHDSRRSPSVRRSNLMQVMNAYERNGDGVVWFGRDLGYRGGRRTGLALTDEAHLEKMSLLYGVTGLNKATKTSVVSERTATEVWDMLSLIPSMPFLWNIFPFHPHEHDDPMSNRSFKASELSLTREFAYQVISWAKPKCVIGLGNDAVRVLSGMGVDVVYVRHPSYGGKNDFVQGISRIFGIKAAPSKQMGFF